MKILKKIICICLVAILAAGLFPGAQTEVYAAGKPVQLVSCKVNYMMDQDAVRKYKEFLVDGLTYSDIITKTYYNSVGKSVDIYILKGSRFESEYQARLYINKTSEALKPDGTINVDLLGESISEAFRKYMNNEIVSDEVKKMIEGVVL